MNTYYLRFYLILFDRRDLTQNKRLEFNWTSAGI